MAVKDRTKIMIFFVTENDKHCQWEEKRKFPQLFSTYCLKTDYCLGFKMYYGESKREFGWVYTVYVRVLLKSNDKKEKRFAKTYGINDRLGIYTRSIYVDCRGLRSVGRE